MAKITYGPLITSANGKIGGVVFRAGRTGPVAQAAPTVQRAKTPGRELAKAALQACSIAWARLSESDRKAWSTYATPSVRPGQVFTPSPALGRAAFFRWYSACWWCNVTPANLWPKVQPFDFSNVAMLYHKTSFPTGSYIVTTSTGSAPLAVLWVAPRLNNFTIPGRPVWSLVTAPHLGDSQAWTLHPTYYPAGYGLDVAALLASRVPDWAQNKEWMYRLRIVNASPTVQPVDTGLWNSGVLYP
jgi:hypothetical protein